MRHAIAAGCPALSSFSFVMLLLCGNAKAQLTWSQVSGAAPPARSSPGMAQSLFEYEVLLFGGLGAGGALGDTWQLEGQVWTQLSPAVSPSPRSHAAMASLSAHLVLFGGRDANGAALGDAWVWEVGATPGWLTLASGPPARESAAFASRQSLGDAVLFGGRDANGAALGDTWFCSLLTVPVWTAASSAVSPPARHGHAMACLDQDSRRIVLFGGVDASGNHLDDTWILEQPSAGGAWIQRSPVVRPSPRRGHVMRQASHRGRVQLFGGEGPGGLLGDTWEWDGTQWWPIATSGAPTPRADAVLVDAAHHPMASPWEGVLFGGRDASGPLADVWHVASTSPARTTPFGGPAGNLLSLSVGNPPWLGSSFTVQVNGPMAPILAPQLIAGFSNTTSPLGPLPLAIAPLNGVTLLVDPVVLLPFPHAYAPFSYMPVSLPATPSLAGLHLYLQAIAYVPTLWTPQWGVSGGIDCELGWR